MDRVLVVDDHPLFREALCHLMQDVSPAVQCVEAANVDEALQLCDQGPVKLILLDLKMPGAGGMDGVRALHQKVPGTPIVVVSHYDDDQIIAQATESGAVSYIPKSVSHDEFALALGTVIDGGVYLPEGARRALAADLPAEGPLDELTPRQRAVLDLLLKGRPNKVIAQQLDISEWTVKAHVTAILRKLGASSRLQAVLQMRGLSGGTALDDIDRQAKEKLFSPKGD